MESRMRGNWYVRFGGRPHGKGLIMMGTSPCGRPYITLLPLLLEQLNEHRSLKGRTVTVDALHTHRKTARQICGTYQSHYVIAIKGK